MDANLDKIAKDLYGKIQTRFPDIRIGDEEANVLSKKQDIPRARFFEFEYEENGEDIGTISITLDSDEGVVIEVSGDIVAKKHPGAFRFIRSFRQFAKDRLLNYDVKRMGKSNLDKRDYAFRSKVKDDMIMENKLFGTSRISYQDLGEAKLIIKHSQPINPDLPAGRTMHIESIYIENALGERFRYPAKHINGARALAEHIKHGGHPYDPIGQHITGLSEELASLRKFKNYVGRQEQLSEAMGDITNKVMERIEQVKKEVQSLQRSAYYEQFAESFETSDVQEIPETVMNDWIDRLTIRTFNEELKSVFPYIYKLVDETELPVVELSADDLLDEETLPWETDDEAKEREAGKKEKSPFKKPHNPNRTGRDTAKALAQKGMPKKEGYDPLQAFEDFVNGIAPDDSVAGDDAQLKGIFDPAQKDKAIDQLNSIFKTELKGGPDDINLGKIKELIPDPDFISQLDSITSNNTDLRSAIEVILHDMAESNPAIADILSANEIKFDGGEEGGSAEEPAPTASVEPTPPAEPAAAAAPAEPTPPAEPAAPAVAEGMSKLKAKLIKAVECGAGPDTELDFGSKKMTLLGALQECGIDPSSIGMKPAQSGIQEILKSISGFWNRDATMTEGNFTIGGRKTKDKVISAFKNGEYKHATKEDVGAVLHMIDKLDPPSNVQGHHGEINRMKQMAGLPHAEVTVDEGSVEDEQDFAQLMKDFQEKHADADIKQLLSKYAGAGDSTETPTPAPSKPSVDSNTQQTGTIDGKPASYDDAMSKFRDIAKGMKFKMPGSDDDMDFDFDNPDEMGSKIQGHVGNMMKGMMDKVPAGQQKIDAPGFTGSMDPQAMMKGIMDKMPNKMPNKMSKLPTGITMEESNELSAMLKIAGLR